MGERDTACSCAKFKDITDIKEGVTEPVEAKPAVWSYNLVLPPSDAKYLSVHVIILAMPSLPPKES